MIIQLVLHIHDKGLNITMFGVDYCYFHISIMSNLTTYQLMIRKQVHAEIIWTLYSELAKC